MTTNEDGLASVSELEQLLREAEGREHWWRAKSDRQRQELAKMNKSIRGAKGEARHWKGRALEAEEFLEEEIAMRGRPWWQRLFG